MEYDEKKENIEKWLICVVNKIYFQIFYIFEKIKNKKK